MAGEKFSFGGNILIQILQESHQRSPLGVSPHDCRLHGLFHHHATRGLLEIYDAVAGRQHHLQDTDGCEGAGVLSVFRYSGQPLRGQVRSWKLFGQPMHAQLHQCPTRSSFGERLKFELFEVQYVKIKSSLNISYHRNSN